LELEICQSISRNPPCVKISAEKFQEILEDSDIWRFDSNDWEPRFVEEFSTELVEMVYNKVRNKIPTESTKIWKKELKEKSISILEEMIKEIPVVEAPTTSPVLMERFEEICSLRALVGKEEPKYLIALREAIEDIIQRTKVAPTTNPATTTSPDSTETFDNLASEIERFINKEEFSKPSFIYLRELSAKIIYEVFQQMFKYIPIEFLDTLEIAKTLIEILKKISQEVLQEIHVFPDEMYGLLTEIIIHRMKIALSINDITFKHYFDTDIEKGTCSSNEREYIVMMKELNEDLAKGIIDTLDINLALDHFLELNLKEAGNV